MDTLAVSASIMDPDDYKNLVCAIQPKGGLIAVGGMSDIKVRVHAMLCYARPFFPTHATHTHTPFPHVTFVTRSTSDLHRQRGPHPAHRPQRPRPRLQAPRAGGGVVVVRQAAAGVRDITLPSPYFCNIMSGTRARTAGTGTRSSASPAGDPRQINKTIYWFSLFCFGARAAGASQRQSRARRVAGRVTDGAAACKPLKTFSFAPHGAKWRVRLGCYTHGHSLRVLACFPPHENTCASPLVRHLSNSASLCSTT